MKNMTTRWPSSGGEMSRRIREHDWASTPLGPIELWPVSLRMAVNLMLGTRIPMAIYWGRDCIHLYNDAHAALVQQHRPPRVFGVRGRDALPDIWEFLGTRIAEILTGNSEIAAKDQPVVLERGGRRASSWYDFSLSPIHVEDGSIGGVFAVSEELTSQKRAQAALVTAAALDAVRVKLADALRQLTDPIEIQTEACRLLGEHLGVSRCNYAEVDGDDYIILPGYANGVAPLSSGRRLLATSLVKLYRRGESVAIDDVEADPRFSPLELEAYRADSVRAFSGVMLIKHGRWVAAFGTHNATPRRYAETEMQLLREIGDRVWEAVERARAEAALRASEARQRFLLELSDRLRMLTDPRAIMNAGADIVGRYLGVSTVQYRVYEDSDHSAAAAVYSDGRVPAGAPCRLSCEVPGWAEALHAGREIFSDDIENDPRDMFVGVRPQGPGVRAAWAIPLMKEGRLVASLGGGHAEPRLWSDAEKQLCRDVAERSWAIVERAQAEAALRVSDEQLRLAMRAASIFHWTIEVSTGRLTHSANFAEAMGIPADPRLLSPSVGVAERIIPEDEQLHLNAINRTICGEGDLHLESRCRDQKTGKIVWAESHATRVVDEATGAVRVVGITQNIDERKRAEETLRESEARFRALIENVSDHAIFLIDLEGSITEWPEGAARVTGYTAHEVLGYNLSMFYTPEDVSACLPQRALHEASRSGHFEEEGWRVRKDGSRFWANEIATAIFDSSGITVGFTKVSRDLSERRRIEQQRADLLTAATAAQKAEEANLAKDEFLAVLSHELRNPLAAIKNGLELLRRAAPGSDRARRAEGVMTRQIDQLARLVDDLLDVTRISRNKVRLERKTLDFGELVRRTVEDHLPLFENGQVKLDLHSEPLPVFIDGDWNRLAQTVGNLLHNAAKFTGRGGVTHVQVLRDPATKQAILRVTDTGAGMTSETLASLFHPFAQAETTLARSQGGLGLGLALVKGLVELHGGDITVRSDGLGLGSEFVVRLPLVIEKPAVVEAERPGARGARRRVLIVEDNAAIADTLRDLLELGEHEVLVAYDGPTGLCRTREVRPEVILCDIGLPGMSGYDFARTVRADKTLMGTMLVALSGYALPDDLRRSAAAGFDHHLAKPADMKKLEEILAHCQPAASVPYP